MRDSEAAVAVAGLVVLTFIMVFGFGYMLGKSSIAEDCRLMGKTIIGNTMYQCNKQGL